MAPQRETANQQQRQPAAHEDSSAAGPAARTRAAAQQQQQQQQQQQHATDMVLPLLLQHDSVRTRLRLVCSLLCCSKAVAAAVAEHCGGQLDIPRQATAAWLRKHARLVQSLVLQDGSDAEPASALVAAGLQTLALQSFKAYCSSSTLRLLEQLPAHSLTHLDWRVEQPQDISFVARLSAALGRLTGLRALALDTLAVGSGELPGLSGLTQLTSLRYDGSPSDLQHAPPQLLELKLLWWQQEQPPLELARLTALTALTVSHVEERDVLPVNLLKLHVFNCWSVKPVLALQQLQQLQMRLAAGEERRADITADQLQQLSRLSALSLDHSSDPDHSSNEPASAARWPLLPLQRLELQNVGLSASVLDSVAQLSGLTSLQLSSFTLPHGAAWADKLAAALRRLSGLQRLQLTLVFQPHAPNDRIQQVSDGMRQLAQAIGGLQQLRWLGIVDSRQLAIAAAAAPGNSLAALTGLTALSLAQCLLKDTTVGPVLSQLPGLQSLDCYANDLDDAALVAIGRLTQLTDLSLLNTRVTDAGLHHLTGLVRLKKLNLAATSITDAGMHHLTGLAQLQEVTVPVNVSVQQRRWLQQQLPDLVCEAEW